MDKPKFVLLIEKGIVIPEEIKIFLKDYMLDFPAHEYHIVETNSVRVLDYMETSGCTANMKTLGCAARARLIDNLDAAIRHYFEAEEGCDLCVISEGPYLRPCLEDYPFAEPVMEFFAKESRAVSLKVYKTDAHENPHLHYFK